MTRNEYTRVFDEHDDIDGEPTATPTRRRVVIERTQASGPGAAEVASRLVALLFGILQALLALRIVFLLLIANRDNAIVSFVLNATDPFVSPFVGMFRLDSVRSTTGVVLDVAALVALIGWSVLEALLLGLLNLGTRRGSTAA